MRTILMAALLASTTACYDPLLVGKDTTDTGDFGPLHTTWVTITGGECSVSGLAYDTSATEFEEIAHVTVAPGDAAQTIQGEPGETLKVDCDGDAVPRFPAPSATFDPLSCPRVYCNPHGGTNRGNGESAECDDNDLIAYIYPAGNAYEGTVLESECGPWSME